MHSYLELLNELREAVSTDAIPEKDKEKIFYKNAAKFFGIE